MIIKHLISTLGIAGLFAVSMTNLVHTHAQNEPQLFVTNNTNTAIAILFCEDGELLIDQESEMKVYPEGANLGYTYTQSVITGIATSLKNISSPKNLDLLAVPKTDFSSYPLGCNTENYLAKTIAMFDGKTDVNIEINGTLPANSSVFTEELSLSTTLFGGSAGFAITPRPSISLLVQGIENSFALPANSARVCFNGELAPVFQEYSFTPQYHVVPEAGTYTVQIFNNGSCGLQIGTLVTENYEVHDWNFGIDTSNIPTSGTFTIKYKLFSQTKRSQFVITNPGVTVYLKTQLCVDGQLQNEVFPKSYYFELDLGEHEIGVTCEGVQTSITTTAGNAKVLVITQVYNPDFVPAGFTMFPKTPIIIAPVVTPELKPVATVLFQPATTQTINSFEEIASGDTTSTSVVAPAISDLKLSSSSAVNAPSVETKLASTPTPLLVPENNEKPANPDSNSSLFTPRNVGITILVASLISALIYFATRNNSAPKA
jgi:hypothetical protein